MKRLFVVLALLCAVPSVVRAQKPVVQTEAIDMSATIEAIDHSERLITFKDKDGEVETVYAGPEVKRFNELKVGDTINLKYYESTAFVIRKAGQPAPAPAAGDTKVTPGVGAKPGATMSKQETATVTIKAIDEKAPSVTVTDENGKTASFRVEDKKNLKGVAVGDKVDITYTRAFVVSVK
jgi:Cu/Ag efflux protein CusF